MEKLNLIIKRHLTRGAESYTAKGDLIATPAICLVFIIAMEPEAFSS